MKAIIVVPHSSSEYKIKDSKKEGSMMDACIVENNFEDYVKHIEKTLCNYSVHTVELPMSTKEIDSFMKENARNWIPLGNHFLKILSSECCNK